MNKAFVREPDEGAVHCPRCGSIGQPVERVTLEAHLPESLYGQIANSACFCPFPKCEVAYFDAFDRFVLADHLRQPVYPKDPAAPICPCFGLMCDDIEADLAEGVVTRVKAHLARTRSPEAHCLQAAPNGQSCVAEVQRYYMRRKGE